MWKKIGRYLILSGILIFLSCRVCVAEPAVSFSLSQREVLLGDTITLTINIRGVKNPDVPQLPSIPGVNVKSRGMSQQSHSSFTVVVNGKKMEQKNSGGGYNFDFELIPGHEGTFTVPAFPILAGGKKFMSDPFDIKVFAKAERSNDIFLDVSVDKNDVYLGEKIVFTFKWYLNKNVQGYRLNIPWLDGLKNFLVTSPDLDKNRRYERFLINGDQQVAITKTRELYKGQPYTVINFQKVLTPISVGTYTLDPTFLKCEVITGYKKSRKGSVFDEIFDTSMDNFFSFGKQAVTESFSTRSDPVQIIVSEVPNINKPESYNGAVGSFDFRVDLKPTRLKVGDPITLTMKVSGAGNIEQLKLPDIPGLEGFKSYEPESKTNVSQKGGEVVGDKIFEKVLIPKRKGEYIVPAINFTFFHPREKQYKTIARGPFNVLVEEGDIEEEVQVIALDTQEDITGKKREIKILKKDIRYIKTNLGNAESGQKEIYEQPIAWILMYLLPLGVLAGLFLQQQHKERLQTDIGFARSQGALNKVQKALRKTQKALNANDARKFYDELFRALNNYLADKLNRPAGSIHVDVVEELKNRGLAPAKSEVLKKMYQTFEWVLFSSVKIDQAQMRQDHQEISDIISLLERILK
ncbi:MAG: protein BatD [PVC group bacterium]|nr:protein BatD [PVC group bacterium]